MILVILGTQDKPFLRILEALEEQKEKGYIQDEIIVQAGTTHFDSKNMKMFDLIPIDEFDQLLNQADVIVTHAGVGSILGALKKKKRVIACARLAEYGEHVNDHQLEIQNEFARLGYLLPCNDFNKLHEMIANIQDFIPNPYHSTTDKVVEMIKSFIDSH